MRVVATAGHVDHGKSSLVLALTGTDPDRFAEEKRRGLTIDLGFAHTTLPNGMEISLIDVPGHVRFVRNMLAGVGGIDACLFVVAATDAWMPQSEEHLRILDLLGVKDGVIALTKIDLADEDSIEIATLDILQHTTGSLLDGAPIVPVSAITGEGIDRLRDELGALVERTPASVDRGRPRLWVDRVFAAKGSGTVVTGTLTGGGLNTDDIVSVASRDDVIRVRAIQTHGANVAAIGPGNRVALNLVGVDHTDVERGDAIVRADQWSPTRRFDATLHVLAQLGHKVSRRGAYAAYIGSGEFNARVRVIGGESIAAGETGLLRVHLDHPVPLLPGDRYILRESGRSETVGGGEVLDIHPVLPASKASPDRDVDRLIAERGWTTAADFERLTGDQRAPDIGEWVASPSAIEALRQSVIDRVRAAGPMGVDLAGLDARERALLPSTESLAIDTGRVRLAGQTDPLADHPFVTALRNAGYSPPEPSGIDRAQLRQLVRQGLIVERDGVYFHADTIDAAAALAARLVGEHPEGFTVAQFRDATQSTRKHVIPLVAELDARGITRRRDDLRIAGPRLPGRNG